MDPAADRRRRRLLIAVIGGGLALLLLIGVGVYGLLSAPTQPTGRTPASSAPEPSTPGKLSASAPRAIIPTGDAKAFAREVAQALFTWDTASSYGPAQVAQGLLDVADATESDALASDVRSYLPTTDTWMQLRNYATRQWLTIRDASVPAAWSTAVEQAAPGQLLPGAAAYTISGTRHRAGVWGTEPVSSSDPVSLTVFMACTPPAPDRHGGFCRLVRLSALNNPLH